MSHRKLLPAESWPNAMEKLNKRLIGRRAKQPQKFYGNDLGFLFPKSFLQSLLSIVALDRSQTQSILIIGPEGSAKTELAYQIWKRRQCSSLPFLKENCTEIKKEADLERLIRFARGGDLFLKDIHCLSSSLFLYLKNIKAQFQNLRILGSVCEDGQRAKVDSMFDIFLSIPPLRERKEDLRRIVSYYIQEREGDFNCSPLAWNEILKEDWKWECEELLDCIVKSVWNARFQSRSYINQEDVLHARACKHVDVGVLEVFASPLVRAGLEHKGMKNFLRDIEAMIIAKGLIETGGNMSELARFLQIPLTTLISRQKGLHAEIERIQELLNFE